MFKKIKSFFKDKNRGFNIFVALLFFGIIIATLKVVLVIESTPELSVEELKYGVGENSKIMDKDGRIIGESVGSEFRSYIKLEDLPSYVPEAFIAIEDKRFYSHLGVDIRGIFGAIFDNIKAGELVRGASTISQQLIKNTHLSNEKTIDRKIKEAYLSFKLERSMTKDEILEAYLNTTFFGQGAYGIESASNIYFSKSAKDLKLEEAAILAAIIQSPDNYAPYKRLSKSNIDYNTDTVLGDVVISGNRFTCVYSDKFEDRRDLVLKEMYKQGRVTKDAFETSINVPSVSLIKPSEKTMSEQMYYLSDFIKKEAVKTLMNKHGYSYEKASHLLDTSGYSIKTSIDMNVQNIINDIYDNRENVRALLKELDYNIDPNTNNMIDSKGRVIYYSKNNILDSNGNFYFTKGEYKVKDGGLYLKSPKIEFDNNNIYYKDYYGITDDGDLYIYNIDRTSFEDGELKILEDEVFISREYLDKNPDFFINDGEKLSINNKYYNIDKYGKKQPDLASIVLNPNDGTVLAMYGGTNNYSGVGTNKAYNQKFSPSKLIRPFSLYYPSGLKENFEVDKSKLSNQYSSDLFDQLNNEEIMKSLEKFSFYDEDNKEQSSLVFKEESTLYNDESFDALVYGRFTKGLSLYDLSKAYSVLLSENNIEPSIINEIVDKNGDIIYTSKEKTSKELDNLVKFKTKMLLSDNSKYIEEHSFLTNKRDFLSVYGSDSILVMSLITNNESKLNFKTKLDNNLINSLILKKFEDELISERFKAPEGIYEYEVCKESGKIASDNCKRNNLSYFKYSESKINETCGINHDPIIEEDKKDEEVLKDTNEATEEDNEEVNDDTDSEDTNNNIDNNNGNNTGNNSSDKDNDGNNNGSSNGNSNGSSNGSGNGNGNNNGNNNGNGESENTEDIDEGENIEGNNGEDNGSENNGNNDEEKEE